MRSRTAGPRAVTAALVGTLALGLWMRWSFTDLIDVGWDFVHLRNAHGHLGYYGVLFPLAWAAWRRADVPIPGRRLLLLYAIATLLSTVGFARAGYGPEAIAGSTVVAVTWLWSVWPLRHRMRDPADPLGVVPLGVAASLACVPFVAINLRPDPDLAYALVATFLAGLLFGVIVPSALASRRTRVGPWPLLGIAAATGAAALGVLPSVWMRAGLALYGVLLLRASWSGELPAHIRVGWTAVATGLIAIAVGLLPNTRPVAIGATHFLILGPVLNSLTGPYLGRVGSTAWALNLVAVALLAGPLVLQGLGAGTWTMTASAVGGSGVVIWWLAALAFGRGPSRMGP